MSLRAGKTKRGPRKATLFGEKEEQRSMQVFPAGGNAVAEPCSDVVAIRILFGVMRENQGSLPQSKPTVSTAPSSEGAGQVAFPF